MLTGTPLDLTPFGVIFANISLIYWGFGFICLLIALLWPRKFRFRYRLISAVAVIVLFFSHPVYDALYNHPQRVANTLRSQAAVAYFKHRCKNDAGIRVYRTADNVDSLLLMKIRMNAAIYDDSDPFYPGAAFGRESGGDSYITAFLAGEWMYTTERGEKEIGPRNKRLLNYPAERGGLRLPPRTLEQMAEDRPGYKYVDVLEPAPDSDQPPLRYRYIGHFRELWKTDPSYRKGYVKFELEKTLTNASPPRYAVTYEDSLDPLDRLHWVAGSTVKVIDTHNDGMVMATLTRYVFSPGLGSTAGNRSPWVDANRRGRGLECPEDGSKIPTPYDITRYFVDQILRPAPWDTHYMLHHYKDDR